ncbi:MAG: Cd(II)/Pb(II)-responsive transcriptional regulator [Burkholderiales bacterium]|jgi:Cd(II)/Pb(II)-responsive transcriptional regulator|uniref:Cd(II)/Pb(II)-responsive transcriptional regulator n=1 Tax=Inhella inkyongensis TaxID=392593 RepID=A0A840S6S5_9BURK|nr:Cd(II)/Pb(II)-responsive transcriptional regulator [Inhella inkyongensis]MBB5205393.1 Cd(II)/Pb(II)-responsive transcriptional regulator [Inhella inkyongensis]MBN8503165.1 Cd(II)/Pb(II)-responsive transcriptional regulator [Burkholderiales bacterium]
MKIGELAKATQTQTETIRYYEREGLLPAAPRTDSNYRRYGPGHVERLALIRRCRSLDMSLDEVRELLRIRDDPDAGCGEVNDLLDEHIEHVSVRLKELKALRGELQALRARCTNPQSAKACGILEGLRQGDGAAPHASGNHLSHTHSRGTIRSRGPG